MRKICTIALFLFVQQIYSQALISDPKATNKTENLYSFLASLKSNELLFGHQDDCLYGLEWKYNHGSDVELVTGNRPAVVGWDIGKLGNEINIDSFHFDQIIEGIKYVYKSGGINTISWHMDNPYSSGDSWSDLAGIKELLPGGKAHQDYIKKLDQFVDFLRDCRAGFTKIPLIFRPFHEHNGDWFWWGKAKNSEQEYIELWQFTVNYLREVKNVHNLIYAFSPDRSRMDIKKESYLYGYPGDDYVDIIGLDNYWDLGHKKNTGSQSEQKKNYVKSLKLISKIAKEKGKIAALTETGNEKILIPNWYSEHLLEPTNNRNINLAWILVWRNANLGHYYVPHKGHMNEDDFVQFEKDKKTLFLTDIENPYKRIR